MSANVTDASRQRILELFAPLILQLIAHCEMGRKASEEINRSLRLENVSNMLRHIYSLLWHLRVINGFLAATVTDNVTDKQISAFDDVTLFSHLPKSVIDEQELRVLTRIEDRGSDYAKRLTGN